MFAALNGIGPGACVTGSASACPGGGSAVASAPTSSLLAPPPDPPSHLRDTSTRFKKIFEISFDIFSTVNFSFSS